IARASAWTLAAGGSLQSATNVRWGTPSISHSDATIAASCVLSMRRRWSTVAASTEPGVAAAASSNNARLSGPPETATPMRLSGSANASKSAEKRVVASAAGRISLAAPRVGLGSRKRRLQRGSNIAGIDRLKLRIGLAGLVGLAELHQRLTKVEKAVLRAFALRVPAIVGEQCLRSRSRLALIEQRTSGEVVRPAGAAMVRIFLGEGLKRLDRGIIFSRGPQLKAL